MSLSAGARLGPYEIVGPLGAGGMGEVYRARDTRLGREVAVKVLPQSLTDSAEVRARFEREARTISSLNHPHICTLHDVGREGDVDYLVMELVEGETLADRLERGPLPMPEVLRLGRQISDALDRAHRAGVVHRDLKPGNVMLTRSGAKLMDFGLARTANAAGGGDRATMTAFTRSPTVAQPLTAQGSILGTFQYMSPEQMEGKEADARSDLWALGCLLYESATGRKAFAGKSQASLIASIMGAEPAPLSSVAPMAPPALERLVRACLAKDPEERIQTAHDVKLQLEWIGDAGSQAGVPAPVAARRRGRERLAWGLAAAGLAATAVLLALRWTSTVSEEPFQGSILPPAEVQLSPYNSVAQISPDGRTLVYVTEGDTTPRVWLRPLASEQPRALEEGDPSFAGQGKFVNGALFWSPDGRYFGYATIGGKLRKIAVEGGQPTTICNLKWARGADWGSQDRIVFAPAPESPLFVVPAAGGEPVQVTTLDAVRHQTSHRFPSFLPDGEHFVFVALPGGPEGLDIFAGSLKTKEVKKILTADSAAVYAPPGYLLYAREGKIVAQPFDAGRLETTGEAVPIADLPPRTDLDAEPVVSASDDGKLVFLRGEVRNTHLEWIDRGGAPRGTVPLPTGPWNMFALSPDQRTAALMNGTDLWLVDLARAIPTHIAPTFSKEAQVAWFPDSRRFAFSSSKSGRAEIYIGSTNGGEPEMVATTAAQFKMPWDVSPDGKFLLFGQLGETTSWDIWSVPLEKDGKSQQYVAGPGQELQAAFSPDGKWVAYQSTESGQPEVYVQAFPVSGNKVRISVDGGDGPGWRRDGKELLYSHRDTIVSVPITYSGSEIAPGAPHPLLTVPEGTTGGDGTTDGERFLVTVGPEARRDIRIILNWTSLLKH
ncbi:MAG TPA: protein kinase [Candidatus Polarisedimenticolia bacterium]|nr:protein kinase [Candidatus Polarisedimenticolia bacterium]